MKKTYKKEVLACTRTKLLHAVTAVTNLFSLLANRNFTHLVVLKTSLHAAQIVGRLGSSSGITVDQIGSRVKCSKLSALSVAVKRKYPSARPRTDRFTAKIASRTTNHAGKRLVMSQIKRGGYFSASFLIMMLAVLKCSKYWRSQDPYYFAGRSQVMMVSDASSAAVTRTPSGLAMRLFPRLTMPM